MITACLATGIKRYFDKKGRGLDKMNIAIPGNIRFEMYQSWKETKLENKFAPWPLVIPLESDIRKSLKEVSKVTSKLRQ